MLDGKDNKSSKIIKTLFNVDQESTWQYLGGLLNAQLTQKKSKDSSPFITWLQAHHDLFVSYAVQINYVESGNGKSSQGQQHEHIVIKNEGPSVVDLTGWRLNAGSEGQDYKFPTYTLLFPNETLRVDIAPSETHSFFSDKPLLNNRGDSVTLINNQGLCVSRYDYGEAAHSSVSISTIFYDGLERKVEGDEFIEVANSSASWVDISNWKVTSKGGQFYVFPSTSKVPPYSSVRVFTNKQSLGNGEFSFNHPTAVWNNQGDTGALFDARHKLISEYSY